MITRCSNTFQAMMAPASRNALSAPVRAGGCVESGRRAVSHPGPERQRDDGDVARLSMALEQRARNCNGGAGRGVIAEAPVAAVLKPRLGASRRRRQACVSRRDLTRDPSHTSHGKDGMTYQASHRGASGHFLVSASGQFKVSDAVFMPGGAGTSIPWYATAVERDASAC